MRKSRLLLVLVMIIFAAGVSGFHGGLFVKDSVMVLDLSGDVPETYPWNPLMSLLGEEPITVLDKVVALDRAAGDPNIKGVVVRTADGSYGFAKAQEFRQAILSFRQETDKPIYGVIETESQGNLQYYIASACEKVYLAPASNLGLTGLSVFRFYLGGLWDKIYVDMQVRKIDEYKSFADMLSREDMSDAERRMQNALLDSLYDRMTGDIAESRGVSSDKVKEWVDAAWLTASDYEKNGVVDGLGYVDELVRDIGGDDAVIMTDRQYTDLFGRGKTFGTGPRVAVVYAVGNIVSGDPPAGPLGRGNMVASDPMAKKLMEAAEDKSIDAVILRVDSGGGSALASDLIWNATRVLKGKKPLVVSMSDAAASGGYYISSNADRIVAQPGTLTGSIGILTARISLGKLMNKINVGTEVMSRGEYADMYRIDRRASRAEMEKIYESISSLYDLFLRRVADGRSMEKSAVNEIGQGRVWTGEQAKEVGLVDALGGFGAATDQVKELLGVPEGRDVSLVYGHEKVTLWKLMTGRVGSSIERRFLTPEEMELVETLRFHGLYRPGQPLAILPGPMKIR